MGLFGGSSSSSTTRVTDESINLQTTLDSPEFGENSFAISGLQDSFVRVSDHGAIKNALEFSKEGAHAIADTAQRSFDAGTRLFSDATQLIDDTVNDSLYFAGDVVGDSLRSVDDSQRRAFNFGDDSQRRALNFGGDALGFGEKALSDTVGVLGEAFGNTLGFAEDIVIESGKQQTSAAAQITSATRSDAAATMDKLIQSVVMIAGIAGAAFTIAKVIKK